MGAIIGRLEDTFDRNIDFRPGSITYVPASAPFVRAAAYVKPHLIKCLSCWYCLGAGHIGHGVLPQIAYREWAKTL